MRTAGNDLLPQLQGCAVLVDSYCEIIKLFVDI